MNTINWRAATREKFEKITEILLSREFGTRGHAVNGRGGDEGIDYDVDDGKIIFQFKFFPDGFPASGSRRTQIRKSFKKAMEHDPDEWILIVPANLTPAERRFITALGKGKRVEISIRDETWLDDQLMSPANKDLADHFLYASDIEYLYARAERFAQNPVVRNTTDVAARVRKLQEDVDVVDPNYTLNFAKIGDDIVQTLAPKDAGATRRSPVQITFTAAVPAGSPEHEALDRASTFGYTEKIRLPGSMIKDFNVTGTSLIRNEGIQELWVGPAPQEPESVPGEMVLTTADGARLGTYLADTRLLGHTDRGATVEFNLNKLITIRFFCPFEAASSSADFKTGDSVDLPIREVFEAADFVVKVGEAASLELRVKNQRLALMGLNGPPSDDLVDSFRVVRLFADDLRVIEAETGIRFRYPDRVEAEDRVMIRNLRLMLEGLCVAHPTYTTLTGVLNGHRDSSLDQFLTAEAKWIMMTHETVTIEILGQPIVLPNFSFVGQLSMTQDDVDAVEQAFANGTADGYEIKMRVRPGDRVRMILSDRRDPNLPSEITPWNIEGIPQKGLGASGEPLHDAAPEVTA